MKAPTKKPATTRVAAVRARSYGRDPLALVVRGIEGAAQLAPTIGRALAPASHHEHELERVGLILDGIESRLGIPQTGGPASERLAYLAGVLRGLLPASPRKNG